MKVTYPARQRVSIWLGTFSSEDKLEHAISRDVEPVLKLPIHLARIAEGSCLEKAVPVRTLLEGFSGSKTFIADAAAKAEAKNISPLNAALICYYLDCSEAPETWGDFIFLGTFSGSR